MLLEVGDQALAVGGETLVLHRVDQPPALDGGDVAAAGGGDHRHQVGGYGPDRPPHAHDPHDAEVVVQGAIDVRDRRPLAGGAGRHREVDRRRVGRVEGDERR
jgi:hypothetical protein